jgi:hypothetical protein
MITRDEARAALERDDQEIRGRLRESQAALAAAQSALSDAAQVRDGVIREALEAGWAMTRVAAALGISYQRVAQVRDDA